MDTNSRIKEIMAGDYDRGLVHAQLNTLVVCLSFA